VATEQMNAIIKEFLTLLAGHQKRVKESSPVGAKLKSLFLVGIKQVE